MKLFLAESNGEKFTSAAGYEITKEKIYNFLTSTRWLCDQIVNTSIENMHYDASRYQLTDSYFYFELISKNERLTFPRWRSILETSKTWIIPLNMDCHWSLILLKNNENEINIECWDSLPSKLRLDKIKSQLTSSYYKYSIETKLFSISYNNDCYIQLDNHSCGIFLIGNIFAFIFGKKPCNLDLQNSKIAIARMVISAFESPKIAC